MIENTKKDITQTKKNTPKHVIFHYSKFQKQSIINTLLF